jgi:hypothetical protein
VVPLLPVAALRDLTSWLNIELISNDENLGVATALNQGVSQNRAEDYVWALLFDYDAQPRSTDNSQITLANNGNIKPFCTETILYGKESCSVGKGIFFLENQHGSSVRYIRDLNQPF